MSNSVNNLKNCVFCLFFLCFLSSCVVVEKDLYEKGTGLEWTYRKYRNGEESFTAAGEMVRGVDFNNHGFGLFSLYSNCYTIYHVTNDIIYKIMDVPESADFFLVSVVGQKKYSSIYPPYSSANKHFVISITYCINQDQSNEEYHTCFYRSDGKYITDGRYDEDMKAVYIDNEYHRHDYIDYYLYRSNPTRKYTGYLSDICAIFNIDGDIIVPLKSYDDGIEHIFWNLADEISNSYYFIANESQAYDANYNANLYDIFSKTGDLLLSIDTKKEIYVVNGKQYEFRGWRREYKRKYGDYKTSTKLWDDVSSNSFHGSEIYQLRKFVTYTTYSSGETYENNHRYLLTKIEDAFYIIHQYESDDADVIESIRIPIESLTSNESVSSSSTNTKSALDMVRDVLMTDITDSFFEDPKSYFIQKATIGKRTDTYEKGESFLIIGDHRMTTQWADGSSSTDKMAPKNITIYDHLDGEEKKAQAYVSDDGVAVRAMNSSGTIFIILYAYNKSMKCYVQMGNYTLYN